MNKPRPGQENGQLPLPTPRSPRELDQRILAHARARAPERHRSYAAGWMGGLATTAVLVVAIYVTNITDTNQAPAIPVPSQLKEKRETVGAAAPMAGMARTRANSGPDLDALEIAPAEQEEAQMAPAAEMSIADDGYVPVKRADHAAPELQSALMHLRQLLANNEQERAQQEYTELRNTCGECGLPETLEEALELLE